MAAPNSKAAKRSGLTENTLKESEMAGAAEIIKSMSLQKLRDRLEGLQESTVTHMKEDLRTMVGEVMREIESCGVSNDFHQLLKPEKKEPSNGKLRGKEFLPRNSLLSDLFQIKHMQTIYHIFIVMLIIFMIQTIITDYMETGTILLWTWTIKNAFANLPACMLIWLGMFVSTVALYIPFTFWAKLRVDMKPKTLSIYVWDRFALVAFIAYQLIFSYVVAINYLKIGFVPFGSAMIVLCEQSRFMMKSHAFVRSNTPRVCAYKPHTDDTILCPGFSQYLYFLFAPTLVYRDTYPRTKEIRWKVVALHATEVLMVIFFMSFLVEKFLLPYFSSYGLKKRDTAEFIVHLFGMMVPGLLIFISGFYLLLHAWSNAWAEALRFADRYFYSDWWNARSYAAFYRNWNNLVHDWLHTYIYKDMYELVAPGNRSLAAIVVFAVSALVHEYILTLALGFFYPVMLLFFGGAGVPFVFLMKNNKKSIGNIFLWLTLSIGNGVMISFYAMEFNARMHCPSPNAGTFQDFFVPRSWTCEKL